MGYYYAGGKTNQHTNAYAKNGETNQRLLSSRISTIRNIEGNFVVFKYLELPNSTQAITRAIEGHVRLCLERDGYKNVQNDHFVWKTTPETKMQDYLDFAEKSMKYAKEYCEFMQIPYIEHDGDPKARKTCKKRK